MVAKGDKRLPGDVGLLAYRELDDALGLTEIAGGVLQDSRTGKNGRHGMIGQFRQSVFGAQGRSGCDPNAQRLGHRLCRAERRAGR